MSTAATATATIPAPKKKTYRDLYEGPATIVSTDATYLRFTDGLTEEEAAAGFLVVLRVQPKDDKMSAQTIELEFSDRECRQKNYIGKKQKDVTREELFAHKLISGGILGSVKGQRGGYYLEKTPDQITLLDIVSIMEGPIRLERRDDETADDNAAALGKYYQKIQQDICESFQGVTIAQIMADIA